MLDMVSLLFLSILVGFIGSLTGLGGASILTPILVYFGIPIKEAIASGMAAIIATSSGAASSFVRDRLSNVKIAMFLEIFTSTGAIIGATITTLIAPVFLYFFFAAFLLLSFIKPKRSKNGSNASPVERDKIAKSLELKGSYYDEARKEKVNYYADNCLLGGAGMFVAGLAAGMLGIGAGAFKVAVQETLLKMPSKVSSSTSSFIIGMTALAGVSTYFFSGLLNLSLMTPMAVGTTIGAMIGGRTLNRFTDKKLKALFFIIVVFIVIQMLYKGLTSL